MGMCRCELIFYSLSELLRKVVYVSHCLIAGLDVAGCIDLVGQESPLSVWYYFLGSI